MGIGPLLLYGLAATAPLVIADLDLSRTQFGLFVSVSFLGAALTSGRAGRLVDRYHERRMMAVLYVGAGAALAVAAMSWSYASLLVAVVLSGAAQALSNPVTNKLVSAHVRARARGLATGIKQSGVQMAQFFAGAALPTVAIAVGWRGALAACTPVAAAGLALSLRHLPRRSPATDGDEEGAGALPIQVWSLAAFSCLTGAAMQATNVYLPLYGYEELDLSVAEAGLITAIVGGVGLVGRIGWGFLSGAVRRPSMPMLVLTLMATAGAVAIGLAGQFASVGLLWAGAVLFGSAGIAANVVVMLALIRSTPLGKLGRASGILAVGLYLGFAIGPVSFGAMVDQSGGYGTAWAAVACVYLAATLLVVTMGSQLGSGNDKPSF